MPLPLLAIPLIVAASSGAGVGVGAFVGTIIGSVVGTAGLVKLSDWIRGKFSVDPVDSLQRQAQVRQIPFDETRTVIQTFQSQAKEASESVEKATTSTNELVNKLQTIIDELQDSRDYIPKVTHLINQFRESLTTLRDLRTPELINHIQTTITLLQEFSTIINANHSVLDGINNKLAAQQLLVDRQNKLVSHLQSTIQQLTTENERLVATVSAQQKKIAVIEPRLIRASQQILFFANNDANRLIQNGSAPQIVSTI